VPPRPTIILATSSYASLRRDGGPAALALTGLVVLLPFEPRALAVPVAGLKLTILEGVAAATIVMLAWLGRGRLADLWRCRPAPLAALWAYAALHVLSAAFTPYEPRLAVKFALRMTAMAVFATAVALSGEAARRRALTALAGAALLVAVLAIAEGLGVRAPLTGFLDLFRETPFNVAGARRATAGSEYPNLAAAFLMYGLLAGVGLLAERVGGVWGAIPFSVVIACGLAFTYSRGAMVAAVIGLVALAVRERARSGAALVPAAAAILVLTTSAAFALRGEMFRLRLANEDTATLYGATYAPAESALELTPGERRRTRVRVTNTGGKTWSREEAFHLSYHWLAEGGGMVVDGRRTVLAADIAPGESTEALAEIQAPPMEGRYLLVWDMVHEDTTWFSGQGVVPARVPVVVARGTAPSAVPASAPWDMKSALVWRPNRRVLWALAVRMWQEHPLLGVGPDNYRHLYGPRAGRRFWDDRVYANNAVLEAAATTGTAGALALAATLALVIGQAARSRAGEAGALLAVATGVAAHGMVDYVLAATGHYLLFGLVVGATAGLALERP
jgi:hypothetical protein